MPMREPPCIHVEVRHGVVISIVVDDVTLPLERIVGYTIRTVADRAQDRFIVEFVGDVEVKHGH